MAIQYRQKIAGRTLTSTETSVEFTNLPQTFDELLIQICVRSGASATNADVFGSFSGQLGTDHKQYARLSGNGSSVSYDQFLTGGSGFRICQAPGQSSTANYFASANIRIPNYKSTSSKVFWTEGGYAVVGQTSYMDQTSGMYTASSAITSVRFDTGSGNGFVSGSSFTIYGISNVQEETSVKATGGQVYVDSNYIYHVFKTSDTFTPNQNVTCDYLVVGGGGGGGSRFHAGAGGAGGLRSSVTATGGGGTLPNPLSLVSGTSYSIIIGAGGIGGRTGSNYSGANGNNSSISGGSISTVTGTGGGYGGAFGTNGATGGSGGGAGGGGAYTGGAGTSNEGYAGGNGLNSSPNNAGAGGGGGGAGAVGTNASGTNSAANGGNGGNGVQITALATPTNTGANSGYYAGGGAGASYSGTNGTGGLGGGGSIANGVNGVANTGGGGGAGGGENAGGNGGSGIVIVRYAR